MSKSALIGIYTLATVYTCWAVYFLFHFNNPIAFLIFGVVASLYEVIAKSIKKGKRSWLTFGLVLLVLNILDGISFLLNKFLFGMPMTTLELSFHIIVFVVSVILLPIMFKVRKSLLPPVKIS